MRTEFCASFIFIFISLSTNDHGQPLAYLKGMLENTDLYQEKKIPEPCREPLT